MPDIKNEIKEILQLINNTTMLFYQQKNDEGYKALNRLLDLLIQGVNDILALKAGRADITIDEVRLNQLLLEAMKAMERKDTILLSDILCYDIKVLLNSTIDGL